MVDNNFIQLKDGLTGEDLVKGGGSSNSNLPDPDTGSFNDLKDLSGSSSNSDNGSQNSQRSFIDEFINPELRHLLVSNNWTDSDIAAWLDSVRHPYVPGTTVKPFSPNPDLSPEENLAALCAWISSITSSYDVSVDSLGSGDASNFANILLSLYSAISSSQFKSLRDLSDAATLEISEKIADELFNFINTQFSAAMSYQSWYLQQEYNSPLNQINRLAAAGLHSAFALGNVNSGNAQSSASMPSMQQAPASNAGQAEASQSGNLLSFIGSIASTAVSMIPGVSSLISGACTLALTPLQLANAKAELKNNGATFEKLQNEARLIEQNLQINTFNSSLQAEQLGLNTAGLQVDQAKNLYEQDYNQFTQELEVEGWRTLVQDKQGHRKYIDLTNEEKEAFKNNGYTTSDGWSSVKDSSSSLGGSFGYSTDSHGSMFGFGAKAESKYGVDYRSNEGKSDSVSGSNGSNINFGDKTSTTKQGYNENGTIERSGETTFTSVTIRKRVPKEQFRQYLQSSYNRYKKALDNYNFLSEGSRARLLNMVDNMQRNAAKYSSMNVYESFRNLINNSIKNKEIDKTLIGD